MKSKYLTRITKSDNILALLPLQFVPHLCSQLQQQQITSKPVSDHQVHTKTSQFCREFIQNFPRKMLSLIKQLFLYFFVRFVMGWGSSTYGLNASIMKIYLYHLQPTANGFPRKIGDILAEVGDGCVLTYVRFILFPSTYILIH